MPLYDEVVRAVGEAAGCRDEAELEAHLRRLIPRLGALRASYRTGRGLVEVDYNRELSEAYLLAYFPHYVKQAWEIVGLIGAAAFGPGRLRLCSAACGPASEIVGLSRRLADDHVPLGGLDLSLFDDDVDGWAWARDLTLTEILPLYSPVDIQVERVESVDISAPASKEVLAPAVHACDVLVFQNCLNELACGPEEFAQTLGTTTEKMPAGSLLVMSDMRNYPGARDCIDSVRARLIDQFEWLQIPANLDIAPLPPPEVLVRTLFSGGEWARRSPFLFTVLVGRKRGSGSIPA